MHDNSMNEMKKFVDLLTPGKILRIADIGSYDVNGNYRKLFESPGWEYTGFDVAEGPNVDVACPDEKSWQKHMQQEYDVVVSGQVLEHVEMPWEWIHVVAGFMKVGGLCCVIAPNTWGFHEFPKDCWRVWPDGLRALFRWGNLVPFNVYASANDTVGCAVKSIL